LPENFSFFPFYSVYGALEFIAKMKSIPESSLETEIDRALLELNIHDLKDRKIKTLSKGQVQRIGLASLLLGDNKLLVLDEPFSGLDPIGIKDLKEILKKEKEKGKTIFINSHILSEMEKICDEIAIIHKGELLVQKDIKSIIEKNDGLENFFASIVPR
jgi:ABC-type multidrug transport system ATPase subunit